MVDRIARASGDVWAPAPPVDVMATEPLLRAAIKRTTTPGVDDYKERAVAFATDQGQRHRAALGVLSTHPDLMAEGWWESESGWYRGDVVSLDSPHDEHLVRALAYLGCGRPLGDRFHPSSAAAAHEVAGIAEKMTGGEIATGVLVLAALMLGLRVERGRWGRICVRHLTTRQRPRRSGASRHTRGCDGLHPQGHGEEACLAAMMEKMEGANP